MALIPQWKVPTIGLGNSWGFDETSRPAWFTVGYQKSKLMLLEFGRGKLVKSINPRIADISKDGSDEGDNSFFMIEGKSPGSTRIEVRNPQTNALETTLIVNVKVERGYGISLNFVEDSLLNKTNLGPGIANDLISELNNIYENQTNIIFELIQVKQLPINIILNDAVREKNDIFDNKTKTGYAKIPQEWQWDKIFAANGNDGFNIYFVPAEKPTITNDTLIFTKENNCIIEDGKQLPIYTLAHSIGRMLGCDYTSDPNKMNQLMYWDSGVGKDFFARTDNFIPRDNANTMNR